jgi:dTDP-4-amino-4,6-dideoxygalactose transaminase
MIKKARFWSTQSRENMPYYHHKEIGYNYRLSNICAGIGRGQLKVLNERINKKNEIFLKYKNKLEEKTIFKMIPVPNDSKPNHWLSVALVNSEKITAQDIIEYLQTKNIEARRVWKPMQLQPVFENCDYIQVAENSVSERLFDLGICLPSDTKMTEEVQEKVIDEILDLVNKKGV